MLFCSLSKLMVNTVAYSLSDPSVTIALLNTPELMKARVLYAQECK